MSGIYEEIEIEDMVFDESTGIYTYPCPCGDKLVNSYCSTFCLFQVKKFSL